MRRLSVAVLFALVVGITVFLVWLHDLRASNALSQLQQRVTDKQLLISKLEKNTTVLQEFLDSDDPVNTRLAAEAKRQNPEMSEEQFRQWLQVNGKPLRSSALAGRNWRTFSRTLMVMESLGSSTGEPC